MIAQVPMKRIGQAEEVAEVAAFLASQELLRISDVDPTTKVERNFFFSPTSNVPCGYNE